MSARNRKLKATKFMSLLCFRLKKNIATVIQPNTKFSFITSFREIVRKELFVLLSKLPLKLEERTASKCKKILTKSGCKANKYEHQSLITGFCGNNRKRNRSLTWMYVSDFTPSI